MFANRASWDLTPNRYARLLAEKCGDGDVIIDLTQSNPTLCGFENPGREAIVALSRHEALRYSPTPLGLPSAREAVARYYQDRGVTIEPSRLILTASTSEAYSFLFKLLVDHGQTVLAPRPSFPLFDFLARLDGVELVAYPLTYEGRWAIDGLELPSGAFASGLAAGARAVLLVSPNNPTGNSTDEASLRTLDQLVSRSDAAIISDEVFADFPFTDAAKAPVAAAHARQALTFSLSGLSKVCGLPQMKLAWIAVGGPDGLVRQALDKLEVIADTYLSTSTPVQLALPSLLSDRHRFLTECQARISTNLACIDRHIADLPAVTRLAADGGWYACLRAPATASEEELVVSLIERDGLAVHPGYFYDFPAGTHVVVSLIVPPERFLLGLERLLTRLSAL